MPRKLTTLLLLGLTLSFAAPRFAAAQSGNRQRPGRPGRPSTYLKNNEQIMDLLKPVVAPAAAATVGIYCDDRPVAQGTVVAADGLIVTKASQLGEKPECRLADGRRMMALVVGTDEETDLALLRVAANNLTPVVWADPPVPGSIVAATAPGKGPLLIGAISDVPQPMPGPTRGSQQHGWLGISVAPVEDGAEVAEVSPGSAADKAGLKNGDYIRRLDGESFHSSDQLIEKLGHMPPNKKVSLSVMRDDKEIEVKAVLGRSPGKMPHDNWGGGPFSDRRWGFRSVLPHDLGISPVECGGPLVDLDGRCVGVNIARALRVASYALPASEVQRTVEKLRGKNTNPNR